jgi:hypothetical protein
VDDEKSEAKPANDGPKPGKDGAKPDAKPAEPPPWLPLPKDFRDFLECTSDSVKLAGAGIDTSVKGVTTGFADYGEKDPKKKKGHFKVTFTGLKDKMSLNVPDPLELDASVDKEGKFHIHVRDRTDLPQPIKDGIRDFVHAVNRFIAGKGKKLGAPETKDGKLQLEKIAVTSALLEKESGGGFLANLSTGEKVAGAVAVVALVIGAVVLIGAGDSTTTETKQVAEGGAPVPVSEQPSDNAQNEKNGFPTGVSVTGVTCASDPTGDWNVFNRKKPGRHDPYVDISRVCAGRIDPSGPGADTQNVLDRLEAQFACGAGEDSLVVCSPETPPIPAEPMFVASARLNGDFPLINKPGEQGRLSLFIDAGGDPSTKAEASETSPNLALAGTNVFREVIIGNPGLAPGQPDPPSVLLNAVDRRQVDEFIESAVRIWLRNGFVTWELPEPEIGPDVGGFRFATTWGSSTAGGDAALNNADVAPGGVNAPFGLLMPDASPVPEPGSTAEPQPVTTTEKTDGRPLLPIGALALAVAVIGGLLVVDERRTRQAGLVGDYLDSDQGMGPEDNDDDGDDRGGNEDPVYGAPDGGAAPIFHDGPVVEPDPEHDPEKPELAPSDDLSPKPYRPPPEVL